MPIEIDFEVDQQEVGFGVEAILYAPPVLWGEIGGDLADQLDLVEALEISIGDTINSGVANNVLFLGPLGVLAQSNRFTYSDAIGLILEPTGLIPGGWSTGLNVKGSNPVMRLTSGLNGYGLFLSGQTTYSAYSTDNWASWIYTGSQREYYHSFGDNFYSGPAIIGIKTRLATNIGLSIRGEHFQSGNLTEWHNASTTLGVNPVASMDINGTMTFNDFIVTSGGINGSGSFYINNFNKGGRIYSCDEPTRGGFMFTDMAATGSLFLQLGGAGNLFPAIKRNGTTIQIRLADDSGYASIDAGGYKSNGVNGFTGTGSYTNFTISGGIITAAT
jgi:hypothetical protein